MTNRALSGNGDGGNTTAQEKKAARRIAWDYLRTFVTILVLWHHSILAYSSIGRINTENPLATSSPVVDGQRSFVLDLMVVFNDSFMMPLMFFISGLFVWRSLEHKGVRKYLGDRLKRLGIPFILGILIWMPLAWYPAQLQVDEISGVNTGYGEFWLLAIRSTPGPLWFLWLLLVFDGIVALLFRAVPRPHRRFGRYTTTVFEHSSRFFGSLLVVSTAAWLPMLLVFGPLDWLGFGPFQAQASRIFFYLVYFLAGTAVGAYGLDHGILQADSLLAGRWWAWMALGLVAYVGVIFIGQSIYPLTCAALGLGFIAIFLRFAKRHVGVFDSLSDNAYGIYIFHYLFVTWLQYRLLGVDILGVLKASLVFGGAFILSLGTTALLRRIPALARVI
jgi:surface polysaccharide O-acyltransferase-like enzyme